MTLQSILPLGAFCFHVLFCRISRNWWKTSSADKPSNNVVLVIDIGSSSIRCSPYSVSTESSSDIRLLSECVQKISFNLNKINRKSIDRRGDEVYPSAQVLKIVDEAVRSCIHSLRYHNNGEIVIHAIGISSFAMNIFGINSEGSSCTPLFTYATNSTAMNTNSADDTLGSRRNNDATPSTPSEYPSHLATTGTRLNHQSYAIAQLSSYVSEYPKESAAVVYWSTLSSMFISKWTVPVVSSVTSNFLDDSTLSSIVFPTTSYPSSTPASLNKIDENKSIICPVSYSEASWMGLFNFTTKDWDKKSVALSLIKETTLPPLTDFEKLNDRKISPDLLSLYPELRSTVFYPGVGDGAAATIGTNCEGRHRISVTIGTSAAVRIIISDIDRNNDNNSHQKEDGFQLDKEVLDDFSDHKNKFRENDVNFTKEKEPEKALFPPSGLFCYRLDSDRLLVGGALTDGGSLLDWFKEFVGADRYHEAINDIQDFYQTTATDVLEKSETGSKLLSCLKSGDSTASSSNSILGESAVRSIETNINTIKRKIGRMCDYINNGKPISSELESETRKININAVNVLPFWSGERSTGWNDNASGTISGISHNSTATSLLLGIMEGLAYRISLIILLMRDSGLIDSSLNACLVASGTALECTSVLKQMIANFSGYDLVCLKDNGRGESTSYGIVKMITQSMYAEKEKEREEETKITKCGKFENQISCIEINKEEKGRVPLPILVENSLRKRVESSVNVSHTDIDSPSQISRIWGFEKSEILSITRPQCTAADKVYIEKRIKENSELYKKIFPKSS